MECARHPWIDHGALGWLQKHWVFVRSLSPALVGGRETRFLRVGYIYICIYMYSISCVDILSIPQINYMQYILIYVYIYTYIYIVLRIHVEHASKALPRFCRSAVRSLLPPSAWRAQKKPPGSNMVLSKLGCPKKGPSTRST